MLSHRFSGYERSPKNEQNIKSPSANKVFNGWFSTSHNRYPNRGSSSPGNPNGTETTDKQTGSAPNSANTHLTAPVANNDNNTGSVINPSSNPLTLLTTLPVGTNPSAVAIAPNGALALVANNDSNTVSVINLSNNPSP